MSTAELHERVCAPFKVDGAAVAVGWVGAAQRLAVDGHRPLPWPLRRGGVVVAVACDQPVAHCGGQGVGVQPAEGAADGGLGGDQEAAGEWVVAGAERGPDWLGVSAAHSAIAAIDRAPVSTAAAAMARMATRGWRRPRAARGSGTAAR
jgi:hypothetical protein